MRDACSSDRGGRLLTDTGQWQGGGGWTRRGAVLGLAGEERLECPDEESALAPPLGQACVVKLRDVRIPQVGPSGNTPTAGWMRARRVDTRTGRGLSSVRVKPAGWAREAG